MEGGKRAGKGQSQPPQQQQQQLQQQQPQLQQPQDNQQQQQQQLQQQQNMQQQMLQQEGGPQAGVNVSAFPSMIPQMYSAPLQQNFDGSGGYDPSGSNGFEQAQYADGQYAPYYQGQTGVYQDWAPQQGGDGSGVEGQNFDPQNQTYYQQNQNSEMEYMPMQYGQNQFQQGGPPANQQAFYAPQQFQGEYQGRDQQNAFDQGGVSLFPPMPSQFLPPQSYAHIFPSTLQGGGPAASVAAPVGVVPAAGSDGKGVEGQMQVAGDPQAVAMGQQNPEFQQADFQQAEFPGNVYSLNHAFSQLGFTGTEIPQGYPPQLGQMQQMQGGQVVQSMMPGHFAQGALPQGQVIQEVLPQESAPVKPLSYADALTRPRIPGQPVPAVRYQARPQTVRAPPPGRGGRGGRGGMAGRGGTQMARGSAQQGPQARRGLANGSGAGSRPNGTARPAAPHPKQAIYGIKENVKVDTNPRKARFFVIKSFSADDIHKSIKYKVWSSTKHGNRRLDDAFRESRKPGEECPVYLFFSVNSSGCFCGLAEMSSPVDYSKSFSGWGQQEKWSGQFSVDWMFVKNIPNKKLRHIRLSNNDGKPFTNSRDTQEVFLEQGKEVMRVFANFERAYSILDDFDHFDKEEEQKKILVPPKQGGTKSAPTTTAATGTAKPANGTPADAASDSTVSPTAKKSDSGGSVKAPAPSTAKPAEKK